MPIPLQWASRLIQGGSWQNRGRVSRIWAYEKEPYRRDLNTEVVAGGRDRQKPFVILRDTIFYPGGGGQPADRGWVNDAAMLEVRRDGEELRHYLEAAVGPGPVRLQLDWRRRFDHMQQHTAQHLLTALALQLFGWRTTAFHLGGGRCDIELQTSAITEEELEQLEMSVVAEIRAARPVGCRRVSPEEYSRLEVRSRGLPAGHRGTIRLVEIAGVDLNTCGGTHVRSTAEIESVKLLGAETLRRATRLHWLAGGRVRRVLSAHEERNALLRSLFECCDEELVEVAGSRLRALKERTHQVGFLEQHLADSTARGLVQGGGRLVEHHIEGLDPHYLRCLADRVVELDPTRAVFLTLSSDGTHLFQLTTGERCPIDAQAVGRRVADRLGGRGGGSGRLYQGKAGSLEARPEAVSLLERELERNGTA